MDDLSLFKQFIEDYKLASDEAYVSEGFSKRLIHLLHLSFPEYSLDKVRGRNKFLFNLTGTSSTSATRWLNADHVPNWRTLRPLIALCYNQLNKKTKESENQKEKEDKLLALELWAVHGDDVFHLISPITPPPLSSQPDKTQQLPIAKLINNFHDSLPNDPNAIAIDLLEITIKLLSSKE